jgi:hypothetical protein
MQRWRNAAMNTQPVADRTEEKSDLPQYEAPRIQVMSEKDILNFFQITQSMGMWWVMATC